MGRFLEEAMSLSRRRKRGYDDWPKSLKDDLKALIAKVVAGEILLSPSGVNWTSIARLVLKQLPAGPSVHTVVLEIRRLHAEATDGKKPPKRR